MNSNISVESPIISTEQPLRPLNLMQESPLQPNAQQLDHTMRPLIQLPISPIGENELNPTLIPSAPPSQSKRETSSASQSSNLRSNVKPHVLLEKLPEPRVLKVSKDDFKALCQVITEFTEQFSTF
jgi:hypothetical protein